MKYLFLIVIYLFSFCQCLYGQMESSVTLSAKTEEDSPITYIIDLDFRIGNNGELEIYMVDVNRTGVSLLKKKQNRLIYNGQLGRDGKGPGEFMELINVQLLADTTLCTYDRTLARITKFDLNEQKVISTINIQPEGKQNYWPMEFPFSNKDIHFGMMEQYFKESDDVDEQRYFILQSYNQKGKMIQDSVLVKKLDDALVIKTPGGMSVNPRPAIGNNSILRFHNNRLYYGWTGNDYVEVYDYEGQKLDSINLPLTKAKEVKNEDFEAFLALESKIHEMNESRLETSLEKFIPDYWPRFDNFLIDEKNHLWVSTSVHMKDQRRQWYILDANDHKVIGTFELPSNFTAYRAKKGFIVGQIFDDDFTAAIHVYKVEKL